jgi:hypothetical protein
MANTRGEIPEVRMDFRVSYEQNENRSPRFVLLRGAAAKE